MQLGLVVQMKSDCDVHDASDSWRHIVTEKEVVQISWRKGT